MTTMNKVRQNTGFPSCKHWLRVYTTSATTAKSTELKSRVPLPLQPYQGSEFTEPFNVTGVDFARLLLHKSGNNGTSKAYITLFTCPSTRAVHLKLCKDMTVMEFKQGLKEFIVRRDAPELIVSDNAKTFKAAKKWLSTLRKDEDLFNFLSAKEIE